MGEQRKIRARHDGFTPQRQRIFFDTIAKTGCTRDGCRAARISTTTVSRWRRGVPGFEARFQRSLAVAAGALEQLAWERATVGAEEKVIRNGELWQVRVKPSDAMLRLLLQAANPRKYGRVGRGGETRTQIEARVRRELARRAEDEAVASGNYVRTPGGGVRPRTASNEEVRAALTERLRAFGVRVAGEGDGPRGEGDGVSGD